MVARTKGLRLRQKASPQIRIPIPVPTHTKADWINISLRCDVSLFSWDPRGSTGRGVRDRSGANWFHQIPTSKERLSTGHWGLLTLQWGLNPKLNLNLNPTTVSGIQSAREPVWSSGRWVGVKAILMSCYPVHKVMNNRQSCTCV